MIKVNSLNKYYNKGKNNQIHVINNATLEIKETGLVAFLGKSGSGKTTLLNVIGGLDKAKGEIKYDNIEIKNYRVSKIDKYRKKNIGYVFQNYSLLHNLTVQENLRIALNLIGIYDDKAIEERIKCSLTSVGMYKYRKRLAGTLSGGQQQRVAIARALVKNAKIIIADEPTGNLDSQNTIEVLNILKQISKTRLVLLVTHDVKLAEFYADRIVEIMDGNIVNDYENSSYLEGYTNKDNRSIYLGDLNKEELSLNNISIEKYSDEEMPNIELKIVYSNGNLYIESPLSIKLVGANTPVRLMDGKYEKMTIENIKTDYNFDFKEIPVRKADMKGFMKRLWLAIKSFFFTKKRTYFLYVAFIITGMLMALCAYNIGKYSSVDVSEAAYDLNAYVITNDSKYNDIDEDYINMIFNSESGIDKILLTGEAQRNLIVEMDSNISEGIVAVNCTILNLNIDSTVEEKLITGRMPENYDECVIDKIIAERLVEKYSTQKFDVETEELIGAHSSYGTITGIVDTEACAVYTKATIVNGYTPYREYDYYEEEAPDVEIIIGKNIDNFASNQCLMPIDYYVNNSYRVGSIERLANVEISIVGFYISDKTDKILLAKDYYDEVIKNEFQLSERYIATPENTKIVEGRLPIAENEIIVPDILNDPNYQIGCEYRYWEKEYVIVGKYDSTEMNRYTAFGSSIKYGLTEERLMESSDVFVYTNDFEKTKAFVEAKGYEIMSAYDYAVLESKSISANISVIFFIIFLLIETILFVYFMMRAKMISRIKDIGIYRALGARKRTIIKDFVIELVVLTTFTTLFGYILGSYAIVKILSAFNAIGDIFVINIKMMIICGVGFYFANIIFGLLPIFLLLRKTPSEIMAKYDI